MSLALFFPNGTPTTYLYALSYTTLFRSRPLPGPPGSWPWAESGRARPPGCSSARSPPARRTTARSEEHTSELQSRGQLVCRLLLEKKKHEMDLGGWWKCDP